METTEFQESRKSWDTGLTCNINQQIPKGALIRIMQDAARQQNTIKRTQLAVDDVIFDENGKRIFVTTYIDLDDM